VGAAGGCATTWGCPGMACRGCEEATVPLNTCNKLQIITRLAVASRNLLAAVTKPHWDHHRRCKSTSKSQCQTGWAAARTSDAKLARDKPAQRGGEVQPEEARLCRLPAVDAPPFRSLAVAGQPVAVEVLHAVTVSLTQHTIRFGYQHCAEPKLDAKRTAAYQDRSSWRCLSERRHTSMHATQQAGH
jgi:hypothetical protein